MNNAILLSWKFSKQNSVREVKKEEWLHGGVILKSIRKCLIIIVSYVIKAKDKWQPKRLIMV